MAVNTSNRSNSDYVSGATSGQETQPSHLAMLAATCSKIGSPAQNDDGNGQGGDSSGRVVGAGQGGVVNINNNNAETISTGWVQLPNGTIVDASGKPVNAANVQQQTNNNLGSQLFAQAQGQQLVATPGPNGTMTYSVVPSFQTVSFDGQEAFFMPQQQNAAQQGQSATAAVAQNLTSVQPNQTQQTLVTPGGQIIRAQGLTPAGAQPPQNGNLNNGLFQGVVGGMGNVLNLGGGNFVSLGGLQNTVRQNGNYMQTVQIPGFQALPQMPQLVQIPVSLNGQTVLQTVQLPAQNLALQSPIQQMSGAGGIMTLGSSPQSFQTIMASQGGQSIPQTVTIGQVEDNSHNQTNSPSIHQQNQASAESQKNELKSAVIQMANQAASQASASKMAGVVNNNLQSLNLINTGQGHVIVSPPTNQSSQALLTVPSYPQTISTNASQASSTTTTASQNAALLQNVLAQQQQLLQGVNAQNLGGIQLAGQNPVWLQQQALNLQSPKAQNVQGVQALQLQNLQGLQNLQAFQALQGIQGLQGLQGITSQGQLINGNALSNVNALSLGAGGGAISAVPLPTQQVAAVQPASTPTAPSQQGLVAAQIQLDPNDPMKWQLVSQAAQPQVNVSQAMPNPTTPVSSSSATSSADTPTTSGRRLKRLACTCPNCMSSPKTTAGGGENKKKQHICHIAGCGKVYGKTSHLRAHLRWHSGDRPFVCTWLFCGKRFTRSDELQRHKRTHTGDKKFKCPECNKRFMRSDHLSKHIRTHNIKRVYPDTTGQNDLQMNCNLIENGDGEEEDEEEVMMEHENKPFRVSLSDEEDGGDDDEEVRLALVA